MKKGDLVLMKEEWKTTGIEYGVGIILEIRYVNTVVVKWAHEIQWCELEELTPLEVQDANR